MFTRGEPAAAIQLPDGRIAVGKTSELMGAAAAALLNAQSCWLLWYFGVEVSLSPSLA